MELKIRVEDYLTQERITEICEKQLAYTVNRFFSEEKNFERILSNAGYDIVRKAVDEYLQEKQKTFTQVIRENVEKVLDGGLNSWDVFRDADVFGRKSNIGWDILQEAIKDSKSQIVKNVEKVIADYPYKEIRDEITDIAYEVFERRLFGGKQNEQGEYQIQEQSTGEKDC